MEVLTSLLGSVRAGLSSAFLTAGVTPALFLMLGRKWYRDGAAGLRAYVVGLLASPTNTTSEILLLASRMLLLACAFYVGRTFALRLLQSMPGSWLSPLRKLLLHRQRERRSALDRGQSQ